MLLIRQRKGARPIVSSPARRRPSRLSAEAPNRDERQRLLEAVARDGFISDYRGQRIAKSGRRFWIEGGTVWQLNDANGAHRGQAALFTSCTDV